MTASPNLKRINVVDDKAQIFQMIVKYAFNIIQIWKNLDIPYIYINKDLVSF